MELLIIMALLFFAWLVADKRGRERINEAAAQDNRTEAYSALGCNLLLGLIVLAIMAFVAFGLGAH